MGMQLELDLPKRNWGGKRPGAGRPRKEPLPELEGRAGVPHLTRERVPSFLPVHVTLKVRNGVGNLRAPERARLIERALLVARERFGMRVVHWSIQGNHLHLIVEVEGREALAKGMQAFAIRVAKRLNALNGQRGAVFVDRYHAGLLRTPQQVKNTIRYVEKNAFLHLGESGRGMIDPLSSDFQRSRPEEVAPQVEPRTWLLRVGWTRARH